MTNLFIIITVSIIISSIIILLLLHLNNKCFCTKEKKLENRTNKKKFDK